MEQYYIGTELKFLINIEAQGFSMDTCDYDIELRCNGKKYQCKSENIVTDDSGNYYLLVDTSPFGNGILQMVVHAYVPDNDFPDGLRTEVAVLDLCKIRQV